MDAYTLWQFAKVFIFYVLIIFVMPAIVLYDSVSDKKFSTRFFVYFAAGNFYIINLVYFLEIFHISYRPTLIAFTVLPVFFIYMAFHRRSALKFGQDTIDATGRLAKGSYGAKNWFTKVFSTLGRWARGFVTHFGKMCANHVADIILIIFLLFLAWGVCGQNMLNQYGYCTYDIVVHNYWINAMSNNKIFVSGIYPYGFHNIAYYIHTVFGVENYDVLRTMWFCNYIMIFMCLLVFLKGISKTKYLPYLGPFMFIFFGGVEPYTYRRYCSSLPQEYSMVFILPAVYFAIEFFKIRKQEVIDEIEQEKLNKEMLEQEEEEEEEDNALVKVDKFTEKEKNEAAEQQSTKERFSFDLKGALKKAGLSMKMAKQNGVKASTIMLFGVGSSFAMSFSTHFYATMVIGLLFVAIAVGYFIRFVKKDYFGRVIGTVFASIVVALLPMLIAFAMGTPLQGSLGWGMNIINKSRENIEIQNEYNNSQNNATVEEADGDSEEDEEETVDTSLMRGEDETEEESVSIVTALKEKLISMATKLKESFSRIGDKIYTSSLILTLRILLQNYANSRYVFYFSVVILAILSLAFLIIKDYDRAMLNLTLFMSFIMLVILSDMQSYHLPSLMDTNRWGCFCSYLLWIFPVMALDGVLYLFLGLWEKPALQLIMYVVSATLTGLGMVAVTETDMAKSYLEVAAYQSNGAITCITNIIQNSEDFTWTFVSANDETQMVLDHGFHYELSEFLRRQEYYFISTVSDSAEKGKEVGFDEIHIPTKYVFIFVEKNPVEYGLMHVDAHKPVSEEFANQEIPEGKGLRIYQDKNRNVTMSRAYYWAQEFDKMYPGELSVFYEDDENVCYMIRQNEYSLYNFAIDYGFNMQDYYSPEAREAQYMAELEAMAQ